MATPKKKEESSFFDVAADAMLHRRPAA